MQHEQAQTQNVPPASNDDAGENGRYLIFSLGGELYASPLVLIKEVIKLAEINPVPYMVAHFRGVINLRGQIVGVVDLRQKFQVKSHDTNKGLILIVEHDGLAIGAIVDDVNAVASFEAQSIDRNPALQTKIPLAFMKGIGKHGDRLVNIIDIAGSLTSEEYSTVRKSTEDLWKKRA